MKTNRLFSFIMIAVLCVYTLSAQNVIPVDSTHLLNSEQENTLKYAKELAREVKSKIELPKEVNNLINHTDDNKYHKSFMQWDKAYFTNLSDSKSVLCVPTLAQIDSVTVESELYIIHDIDDVYYRIVHTTFVVPTDTLPEYICLKSDINGGLVSTIVYDDNNVIAEIDTNSKHLAIRDSHTENLKYMQKAATKKRRSAFNVYLSNSSRVYGDRFTHINTDYDRYRPLILNRR